MSSNLILIVCSAMGLLVALICLRQLLKSLSIRRLILNTPTTPIRQLSSGMREVKGHLVLRDEGKLAPLSNERVAYYHFTVAEPDSETKGSFRVVEEDEYFADVALDDGTGTLRLQWEGAELVLRPGHTLQTGLFRKGVPADLKERLQRLYGYDTKGFLLEKTARFTEKSLTAGCELYAIGRVSQEQNGFVMNAAGGTFLVGDIDESSLAFKYKKAIVGYGIGAVLALVGSAAVGWIWAQVAVN